ncbi:hypothetical protein MK550_05370 [Streptococcus dysgalactiae]|nr:hypothetical protein [Streptococcus dysgalactiae]MCY7195269.1 hypothetical protein [Streptococcus dysgalactiae]MCY7200963.1 hypothetical protein [Streptococcus dysgalactiae]MCY7206529.1 hypothetical protein [Streptococcus dysgalactiae]MCY7215522.1 hypothetical protein [Streptococcus dysgalactiae]WEQ75934.1 hypothetical protein MGCS36089_02102 [Streptococcus dysgalactiae subsp. equisimilis]
MIKHFKTLNKQVLLSATLKNQEYIDNKYENLPDINAIDYNINNDSKILDSKYIDEFIILLKKFNIEL